MSLSKAKVLQTTKTALIFLLPIALVFLFLIILIAVVLFIEPKYRREVMRYVQQEIDKNQTIILRKKHYDYPYGGYLTVLLEVETSEDYVLESSLINGYKRFANINYKYETNEFFIQSINYSVLVEGCYSIDDKEQKELLEKSPLSLKENHNYEELFPYEVRSLEEFATHYEEMAAAIESYLEKDKTEHKNSFFETSRDEEKFCGLAVRR